MGSFLITNYSVYRNDFLRIVKELGPYVYILFFTLTGAMISLDVMASLWFVVVILFGVRLLSLFLAGYTGSAMAGDPRIFRRISWMPYVTQAGISLGLATEVAGEFTPWGGEFATIVIAVIVINQLVGPPLFKWAIQIVGESYRRGEIPAFDGIRNTIIFGLEDQSIALARQLQLNDWQVKIATLKDRDQVPELPDVQLEFISSLDLATLE